MNCCKMVVNRPLSADAPQTTITTMGSHLRARVQRRPVKPHRMLLPFKAVQAQFGDVVSRWFDYFNKVSAALDLYFAVRISSTLYLEHRFLFLAQAVEVYHRLNFEGRVLPKADCRAKLDRIVAGVPADKVDWVREKLLYPPSLRLTFTQHRAQFRPTSVRRRHFRHRTTRCAGHAGQ